MLEEQPSSRKRVGSAHSGVSKVGSARQVNSRVSSARQVTERIGSARPSSETRHAKLHIGRPASAPPGRISPHNHTPARTAIIPTQGFVKTHDVGHLNLKVEGKSIRSVAYGSSQKSQPVSRGSVHVVSHYTHAVPGSARQFHPGSKFSPFREVGSDSESSSVLGFGTTYTFPFDSMVYSNSVNCQHSDLSDQPFGFGTTFTKEGCRSPGEHRFEGTYTLRSPGEDFHLSSRVERVPPDGKAERIDPAYQLLKSTDRSNESCELGNSKYNIRPQSLSRNMDAKSTELSGNSVNNNSQGDLGKRDTDSASNDGSESTVMSLGQKIQIMASSPQHKRPEENWDSEWKQLLKQNHELLLKLSSREDLHIPDSAVDSSRNIEVCDSSIQTFMYGIEKEEIQGEQEGDKLSNCPEDLLLSESDPLEYMLELKIAEGEDIGALTEAYVASKSPDCELEDIIEESSFSDKSSPRETLDDPDEDKKEGPNDKIERDMGKHYSTSSQNISPPTELSVLPVKSELGGKLHFTGAVSHESTTKPLIEESPTILPNIASSDISCTADLPTYHTGSAMTCLVFSSDRFTRDRQVRIQPSKDLVDALKMIEEEEKQTIEELRPVEDMAGCEAGEQEARDSRLLAATTQRVNESRRNHFVLSPATIPSTLPSSTVTLPLAHPSPATLPVLQVLVEKVSLFTQDLAERWKLGGDGTECHEDLVSQVVAAERLLEGICVGEGRKRDPNMPPEELHTGCQEEALRRQQESDARIHRNLELIRKLMDDKRALTERCEELHCINRVCEKKHADKVKQLEEHHREELKGVRERVAASELEKREKWTRQKTRVIKETTYRGLETKIKDLSAKHRDEISQLKAEHWQEKRQVEEKFVTQLRAQEEELKRKYEEEKEDVCKREREREQQRVELEVRQSEQHALARLESVRKQHEHDLQQLLEEYSREQQRQRDQAEGNMQESLREKERVKEEYEAKIRQLIRTHQDEISEVRQKEERTCEEWRERVARKGEESKQRAERELRERLKRQRDREIERAIREVQREAELREKEALTSCNSKIKNLRDKYESELSELESSERGARERYLEMRSVIAQKEEEIVYLHARLHTQDLELNELQHMFRPPED